MVASLPWLFFALMTVVGSAIYNIAAAKVDVSISPYVFAFILNAINVLCCTVILFANPSQQLPFKDINLSNTGIWWAVFAGIGVTIIDICYIQAMRTGSPVASQLVWTVGGTIVFTAFAWLFLSDRFTWQALIGIAFAICGIFLVITAKQS